MSSPIDDIKEIRKSLASAKRQLKEAPPGALKNIFLSTLISTSLDPEVYADTEVNVRKNFYRWEKHNKMSEVEDPKKGREDSPVKEKEGNNPGEHGNDSWDSSPHETNSEDECSEHLVSGDSDKGDGNESGDNMRRSDESFNVKEKMTVLIDKISEANKTVAEIENKLNENVFFGKEEETKWGLEDDDIDSAGEAMSKLIDREKQVFGGGKDGEEGSKTSSESFKSVVSSENYGEFDLQQYEKYHTTKRSNEEKTKAPTKQQTNLQSESKPMWFLNFDVRDLDPSLYPKIKRIIEDGLKDLSSYCDLKSYLVISDSPEDKISFSELNELTKCQENIESIKQGFMDFNSELGKETKIQKSKRGPDDDLDKHNDSMDEAESIFQKLKLHTLPPPENTPSTSSRKIEKPLSIINDASKSNLNDPNQTRIKDKNKRELELEKVHPNLHENQIVYDSLVEGIKLIGKFNKKKYYLLKIGKDGLTKENVLSTLSDKPGKGFIKTLLEGIPNGKTIYAMYQTNVAI